MQIIEQNHLKAETDGWIIVSSKWYNATIYNGAATSRAGWTCMIHKCRIPVTSKMELFVE